MFSGKYAVLDGSGREIIRIHLGLESRKTGWREWARTQGTVEVDPGPYDGRAVLACTVIAWFLVLQHREFDGTSGGAMVAIMG